MICHPIFPPRSAILFKAPDAMFCQQSMRTSYLAIERDQNLPSQTPVAAALTYSAHDAVPPAAVTLAIVPRRRGRWSSRPSRTPTLACPSRLHDGAKPPYLFRLKNMVRLAGMDHLASHLPRYSSPLLFPFPRTHRCTFNLYNPSTWCTCVSLAGKQTTWWIPDANNFIQC